mgnify:CR=1 FL=1
MEDIIMAKKHYEDRNLKFETLQLHVGQETPDPVTDARAVPIYLTSSYVFHNSEHAADRFGLRDAGNIYGRLTNPTEDVFERRIAALEGGVAALAVGSGAAALTYAFQAVAHAGDHIVAAKNIYGGTYNLLAHTLPDYGIEATFVDPFDYDGIKAAIKENTKAIVCTHGSNLTGNKVDVERIGEIAQKHGLLFVVDASQTAGVFPIDVQKMHIDILCFTGHKGLLGPQGTGGMYVRKGVHVRPLLSGGTGVQTYSKTQPEEMPTALEAGTLNGHGIAGLDAAIGYLEETGIDTIRAKEQALMKRFYEGVKEIPGVKIYGDFSSMDRCAVVSLNIRDYDSGEVSDALLTDYGISTRSGGHCAPLMHEALGTVEQGAVRFSFSHYNTEEEVDTAIRAVCELAEEE